MTNQLKQLSEAATQGEWDPVPWHIEEDCAAIRSDSGWIIANTSKDADASLAAALVNAYRAGELIPASEARAQVAVAYEVAAGVLAPKIVAANSQEFGLPHVYEGDQEAIRALTPDDAATALEQIKQTARDEGKREARRAAEARVAELEAGNGILHTEKHADAEAIGSLLSALTEIRDWRKSCHEYDKENGHDLREFDVEDLKMMEICASAAIKGASND